MNIAYQYILNDCRGKKLYLLMIVFLLPFHILFSQQDTLHPKRLKTVLTLESVGYVGVMTGLNSIWYDSHLTCDFHTVNDNANFEQMDKVGHSMTAYYVGLVGYEALKWSGVERKKAIWYGGSLGSIFLSSVEIFDGFSPDYGCSWGDVVANTLGTGMFIGQQLGWDEQRILLKYSYHKTKYIDMRPNLFGTNLIENATLDYNGQTYWASVNVASFLKGDSKFPKWLNVAVGYGAEGMVERGAINVNNPEIRRYRQYYLSLDVDLTKIKTKSAFLNTFFGVFGFVKFPLPTVEFNQGGETKFYGFYF